MNAINMHTKECVRDIISHLKDEIAECRQDILISKDNAKEYQTDIKNLKTQITDVGKEITEYEKDGKTTNSLRKHRDGLELSLSDKREQLKSATDWLSFCKEKIRIYDHVISKLKSEFDI